MIAHGLPLMPMEATDAHGSPRMPMDAAKMHGQRPRAPIDLNGRPRMLTGAYGCSWMLTGDHQCLGRPPRAKGYAHGGAYHCRQIPIGVHGGQRRPAHANEMFPGAYLSMEACKRCARMSVHILSPYTGRSVEGLKGM